MASIGWSRFKELSGVVTASVIHKQHDAFFSLEKALRKHKLDFLNLLKNPSKNSSHRSQVLSSSKQGLKVSTVSHPLTLPQDFIDESLILSDILDLNEISSVELLLAGEQQMPNFLSLTRGLVAVLVYYDSKRTLVTSLRSLIQAREGVSWTLGLASNVTDMITKFTDDLLQNGLVQEILKQVDGFSVEKELESLSNGEAIKDSRHRQQITDLIEDTKHAMMDCLFYWSCQNPFDKDRLLVLLKALKKVGGTSEGHHPLDYTTLAMFFTLVSSFSVSSSLSHDSSSVDILGEELPVFNDRTLIPSFHSEVIKEDWTNPALGAAVQFAWAVFLRECCPFDALSEFPELQDDEELIDAAIDNDALQFIRQSVIASPLFIHEEYYVRRLHHIMTSFIVLMPNKVNELGNRGDEAAREELLRATRSAATPLHKLRQDFGEMMKVVGDLYYEDPNGLNLSLEYWAPVHSDYQTGMATHVPHRQLSLLKFVHQCSNLLPPPLFTSFMTLLIGLSNSKEAASHCFNFLKSNSPSLGGGGPSASFSLDHFFHSLKQYYYGLKQEARSKQTPTGCSISPQEVEGLLIVLRLIKMIAKYDENARVVMYENQTWLPVASMFGLIGCAIPRVLKSEIFLTLAEFARSPEIAATMWQTLENSQVLNTVPNIRSGLQYNPSSQEGSIQIELEEIEAKEEDYPQTRAFLSLVDALTDVAVPSSLGMGHRVPGFNPYLEFIRDSVLLKFDTRAYKDPQEKWLVAARAMEVILKLLSHHQITPHDFEEQMYEISPNRMVPLAPPPGHVILHHLLNDSTLLRKILFIVDNCCILLSDVDSSTDAVAHAALLALKILDSALEKQETFFSVLRETSGHSVMATPLDHLLLSINPRTRNVDYYVSIARCVTFSSCSPELPLTAVRILCTACRSATVASEMLSSIVAAQNACVSVMYGFVEHLEWEDLTPPTSQGGVADINMEDVVDCEQAVDVRRQLKEEIVRLLMVCVQCPGASIGRLLLGFMQPPFEKKKMKTVALQDPGVLGALKSCLHSVLNLVAIGNDPAQSTGCHMTHPKLAERCYHLLHLMCANADLSQNTMRYLRNSHNFFRSQLTSIPFQWIDQLEESAAITSLKQQAWILSSVALEMRMTILKNQRSHAQQLVSLLLKSTTLTDQFNSIDQSMDQIPVWSTAMNIDVNNTQDSVIKDGRQKILSVLDCISFESLPIPPLELQLFDVQRTENVIKMCETSLPEDGGLSFIDIKSLRNLLMTEFNSIQSSTVVSQKHFILEEISGILRTVVQRNHAWEVMHCQQQVMDSWCKVVEIMVGVVGEDNETEGVKISVLFEIVQDLLLKVENTDANSLTASAHGVIFTLMAHLRQSLLHHSTGGSDRSLGPLAGGPLQSIFRSLLNCLVNCPVGMQRLRAHLYSSLLSYLQMTKEKQDDKSGLWRLEQDTGLSSANLSVLSECGEGLMDVVCRDACSGHDVAKMLSLSLLDYIVNLDRRCHWLQFMTARGYLQKICSSFLWDDDTLQGVLHPQPEALKPLYIYESKMAFLNRVASVPHGARDLITFNCLTNFNECKYIGCRPGNQAVAQPQSKFIPSVNVRYLQLLLPVLRLLLTLLTTPGHHTKDATNQVFVFIRSHMDVFMAILKDGRSLISMGILQELSLITAVIGHCKAGQDWMVDSNVPHARELVLIQSLLLSLLPNFLTPLHWKKIAQEVSKNEEHGRGNVGGVVWEEAYGLAQQVCSNLMTFCQNAVTAKGSEFSVNFYRILFTPDLSVAIAPPAQGYNTKSVVSPPSLGLLVSALKNICDGYFTGMESVQQLQKKVDGVRNMTSEEMKQLIPEVVERNILTTLQLQNMSKAFLQRLLEGKKQQTQTSIYIVEHMLCILWRHLQFFLIHCKPTNIDGNSIHDDLLVTRSTMRRLHGESSSNTGQLRMQGGPKERFDISHLSDGITVNDLEQLKVNIVKCLTDSMFKKLLDINDVLSQSRDDSTVGFIHALVRRIKKLLNLKAAAKPILHL